MGGGKGETEGLLSYLSWFMQDRRHAEGTSHKKGAQQRRDGMMDRYRIDSGTMNRSSRSHPCHRGVGRPGTAGTIESWATKKDAGMKEEARLLYTKR